jgi:hypothetical protein
VKRPRRVSDEERERRRLARQAAPLATMTAVDPAQTRTAVRRARAALAFTVAGWVVSVAGAAWFASRPGVVDLRWGFAVGGRFGHGSLVDLDIDRGNLVALAAGVTALPVLLGVLGLWRTPARAREGRRAASRTSAWSGVAALATLAAVPNVLGCYALSSLTDRRSEWILIPMFWPQLGMIVLLVGVGWAWYRYDRWRRDRGPRYRRTLSGKRVPVTR